MLKAKRPRTRKSPEDRRRDLLEAAAKVLAERGVASTTVSDITEAAGVAKGTFYLYFDSKDHVIAALRERFVTELTEHAMPFVQRIGRDDWWSLADAVAEDMVDWTLAHRDSIAVLMQSYSPETYQQIVACDRNLITFLAAGIQVGVDQGAFEVADPELAASFFYNGIIYTVCHQILLGGAVDRDRLVAAAKSFSRKLLTTSSLQPHVAVS
jgi:AcrR family transcriptional regulator